MKRKFDDNNATEENHRSHCNNSRILLDGECVFSSPALDFQFQSSRDAMTKARAATIYLPHGTLRTPVFMPVGTKGCIKGLSSKQLKGTWNSEEEDCDDVCPEIILGNTYHLASQPGTPLIAELGGLHKFMNWRKNVLTDSGGFQMVSLLKLAQITEEGVKFSSPVDGKEMMLTPEESIKCQNEIGADIIMQLDDVVSSVNPDYDRFKEATARSVRWLDRCIQAHSRKQDQNLFGIIQGGLDISPGGLREQCLTEMVARDLPGYAIGGLAGGEDKETFWRVVAHNAARLPANKPRYVMGVGYPLDLVVCVALGADMFDCVYPTRTARFGVALVGNGSIRLKASDMALQLIPVEDDCPCIACKHYSRAILHVMFKENNALASQLLTAHNITIIEGPASHEKFVLDFLAKQFPAGDVPLWVVHAFNEGAGLSSVRSTLTEGQATVSNQCREKEEVDEEHDRHST
eukprot:gene21165-27421_t